MKKCAIVLAIISIVAIPIYAIYDFLVVDLDEIPEGEFLSEYPSPNEEYIARAYLIDNGGATVRTAIRVEIKYGNEVKAIYWNYDEHTINLKWLDNKTVEINEHQLNIIKDTYNWKVDPRWEENRGKY